MGGRAAGLLQYRPRDRVVRSREHGCILLANRRRQQLFLHRTDAEKRKAEEELRRLFTLSNDLLCVVGFDGYFKVINPAWERELGFPEQELLTRPYSEFIHPDDREKTAAEASGLATGTNHPRV